jgi:hypothetical protein
VTAEQWAGPAVGVAALAVSTVIVLWGRAKSEGRYEQTIEKLEAEKATRATAEADERRQQRERDEKLQERRIIEVKAQTELVGAVKEIREDVREIRTETAAATARVAAAEGKVETVLIEQANHRTQHHDHFAPSFARIERQIIDHEQRLKAVEIANAKKE